jgi:uncharacterized repeat protein (TIGR01451 family)
VVVGRKTRLGFFFDDNLPTDKNEATDGGTVYSIKLWQGALTADQIQQALSNQTPVITSNGGGASATVKVFEGTTAVTTVTATDADNDPLTFGIAGGADAAKFTFNASTGVLVFASPPAYSPPADADGDNHYEVKVQVDDGRGGTKSQDITVVVLANGLAVNNAAAIDYVWHSSPAVIAPNLIVSFSSSTAIDQARVDISANYQNGGDVLGIAGQSGTSGTVDGLSWSWDASAGVLSLSGSADEATYQGALRKVTFANSYASPTTAQRTVTFSLGSGLQYPGTGHFYEFIANDRIPYADAESAAAGKTYFGYRGYLVTVTSRGEADFILAKLGGKSGWIGAKNADESGTTIWRWRTGPEGLEDSGKGRAFWEGQVNGSPVNGNFSNWINGVTPNLGAGGAAYFIRVGCVWDDCVANMWDDIPVGGTSPAEIDGYVVEYGGMTGDAAAHLADDALVNVVAPDLTIAKRAIPSSPIVPGQPVTYTVRFSNAGLADAPGVTITDTVPAELSNVSYTSSGVTVTDTGASPPYVWQVQDLAPGQSGEIHVRGELKADLAGGLRFTNTATISTSGHEHQRGDNSSSAAVEVAEVLGLAVSKTPSAAAVEVGHPVTYTYRVTNTGNVSLSGLVAMDDKLGAVTLDATTLATGASTQGELTYTVLESDLPGPLVNSVEVTGTTPLGGHAHVAHGAQVALTSSPAIELSKMASAASAEVGHIITYTYRVTNTGDVGLTGITVTDSELGAVTLDAASLAPGASTQGQLTYTVVESDLPGPLLNTAQAVGSPATGSQVSDSDSASVSLTSHPNIAVSKTASAASVEVGHTITYTYRVTNTGNVLLRAITAVDDRLGAVTLGATSLPHGQSTGGTLSYTVQESDLPGPLVNGVVATGDPANGPPATTTGSASVGLTTTPVIAVSKTANVSSAQAGDTITYTYRLTNSGDVSLNNVTAVDDQLGAVTLSATSLAPGASTQGQLTYTVVLADLPGPLHNLVEASGDTPLHTRVKDYAGLLVALTSHPLIGVTKTPNISTAHEGDTVTYTYKVTNLGDVTLSHITAVDVTLGPVALGKTTLALTESTEGTLSYVVVASDLPGPVTNRVEVASRSPTGAKVVAHGNASVALSSSPAIEVRKAASAVSAEVGHTITYTYRVTNRGNVTLSDVTAVDDKLGPVALGKTTLAPAKSTEGTLSYVVVESDLPGPLTNSVEVTGTAPVGGHVHAAHGAQVALTSSPAIELSKTPSAVSAEVGDTITYTYRVTNTGDVSLSGITVTDSELGAVTLDAASLAPGASTQGQLTYTVVQSDLPGPLLNTAQAVGSPATGSQVSDSDSASVSLTSHPNIAVSKTASAVSAEVGDTITYTYRVTNTGDISLDNVTAVDDQLGAVTLGATSLSDGQSTGGTLSYTVQESDLPGPLVNGVVATADLAGGPPVTTTDSASVGLTSTPAIGVIKKADVTAARVGEPVTYSYRVTNQGNVTLSDVTAVDDKLGAVTLGKTTLAPGESTDGTSIYVVVAGDLPGPLVNRVDVTAKPVVGADVGAHDDASIDVSPAAIYLPLISRSP